MTFLDIINDGTLEQLVTLSTRCIVILDLVLSRAQDLVRDVAHIWSSGHNAIKFSVVVNGKLQLKSKTVTLNFKRGNFTKMKGLVKRKLKGTHIRTISLENAWKLFKSTLIEVQIECFCLARKVTAKP